MKKLKIYNVHRKCLICGKTYPSDQRKTCRTRKDHRRLFTVESWYPQKTEGDSIGKRSG